MYQSAKYPPTFRRAARVISSSPPRGMAFCTTFLARAPSTSNVEGTAKASADRGAVTSAGLSDVDLADAPTRSSARRAPRAAVLVGAIMLLPLWVWERAAAKSK